MWPSVTLKKISCPRFFIYYIKFKFLTFHKWKEFSGKYFSQKLEVHILSSVLKIRQNFSHLRVILRCKQLNFGIINSEFSLLRRLVTTNDFLENSWNGMKYPIMLSMSISQIHALLWFKTNNLKNLITHKTNIISMSTMFTKYKLA